MPPEYNPDTEKVIRVVPKTKSQALVETERKGIHSTAPREYVLKKQDGIWLIDSVSELIGSKKMKVTLV